MSDLTYAKMKAMMDEVEAENPPLPFDTLVGISPNLRTIMADDEAWFSGIRFISNDRVPPGKLIAWKDGKPVGVIDMEKYEEASQ